MTPNEQQVKVIHHVDGPCLVAAVPGSGKTTAMTERIKNLVQIGKNPESILAITFTNKAADEMRRRITVAVGDVSSKMTISTFHSLCARIIRANSALLGLSKTYTIYDDDDQERMLRKAIFKVEGEDFSPTPDYWKGVRDFIEGKRNNLLTDEDASTRYRVEGSQLKAAQEYLSSLKSCNAIDFTGLLSEVVRLFEENPKVLEYYSNRFKYVNVDEWQDTNVAQYRLVKLIASHRNVLVVGDVDQSIYAFRGAMPENVLQFEKDFEPVTVLKLEKNYRSTPQILGPSHLLITKNALRKDTNLVTDNPSGEVPVVKRCGEDREMALKIAMMVKDRLASGTPPKEIAIFYRVNYASRVLEEAMRAMRIAYKVIGGQSFYSRMEVRTSLAILKLISNPSDKASFHRVAEFCCRGVGEKTIGDVLDAAENGKTVVEAAREYAAGDSRTGKALSVLVTAIDGMPKEPHSALLHVARTTAFWDKMRAESSVDNDRCENISELAEDVYRHVAGGGTLDGYLQNISLLSSADEEGQDQQVKLMTMHACKGLEFDVVFISHANQKIVPHQRVLDVESITERSRQIEEERRLFYVAMTRARKRLAICYFERRKKGDKYERMDPSQFIAEAGLR